MGNGAQHLETGGVRAFERGAGLGEPLIQVVLGALFVLDELFDGTDRGLLEEAEDERFDRAGVRLALGLGAQKFAEPFVEDEAADDREFPENLGQPVMLLPAVPAVRGGVAFRLGASARHAGSTNGVSQVVEEQGHVVLQLRQAERLGRGELRIAADRLDPTSRQVILTAAEIVGEAVKRLRSSGSVHEP